MGRMGWLHPYAPVVNLPTRTDFEPLRATTYTVLELPDQASILVPSLHGLNDQHDRSAEGDERMAAIEYGSNYFCVMLEATQDGRAGDTVLLHADSLDIDATGTLKFTSLGRRAAGADPKSPEQGKNGQTQPNTGGEKAESQESKPAAKDAKAPEGTIFMAFAPGTWRVVYAAKLQDGAPASVEHWNASTGKPEIAAVPPRSGAEEFVQPVTAR